MKRRRFILGVVVAMAMAGASCSGSPVAQSPPAAPSSTVAKPAATVPAESSDSQEILSVLSVEHEVDLLSQREGAVTEIVKDEGSRVQKGQVLARLDDRQLAAQSEKAEAELRVTQNDVKYLEAELKAKRAYYHRQQELRKYGLGSDADLEKAEFEAKGAEYDVDSQRSKVERSQAEIRTTQLELEKTRIRAPFGGVVVRRYIRQGQDVVKDDKCFRVSQLSPLRVQFQVSEASGHRPQPGDEVKVTLVSDSQQVYSARISRVSPTVDAASGSYDVTAQLTGHDLTPLRPGMSVRVVWPPQPANLVR
jgi:membrane fusion protein, multidrug efflux system